MKTIPFPFALSPLPFSSPPSGVWSKRQINTGANHFVGFGDLMQMRRLTTGMHHKQAPVFQPEIGWFAISRFDLEFANTTEAYGSDGWVESHRWFIVSVPTNRILSTAVLIPNDDTEFVTS